MSGVYHFDMDVFRAIHLGWHEPWLDPFFTVLSYMGLGGVQAALALLFLLHRSTRRFVLPLLLVDLVSGVFVADEIKTLLPRDRPSNLIFAHPQEPLLASSFPSGHTTTSFGIATMILLMTWNTRYRWTGYIALVWAALVGLSRIYRGVHWPTDVLGGICCGVFSACLLYFILPLIKIPVSTEPK